MSHDRTFSSSEALRFGWSTTKAHLWPLVILGLAGAFLGAMQQALARSHAPVLSLAIQLIQVVVTLVWIRVVLRLADGQPIEWSGALLDDFLPFLLTVTLVGLITAAGFVLLIVPGVIWGLKFCFSPFLTVDRKLDPIAALHESSRLTDGKKGHLFEFALLMLGVNLLGALAFGVGLLVTIPTTWIAAASVYRKLQAAPRDQHFVPRVEPTPA